MRVSQMLRLLSKSEHDVWVEPWAYYQAPVYSFGNIDELPHSGADLMICASAHLLPSKACVFSVLTKQTALHLLMRERFGKVSCTPVSVTGSRVGNPPGTYFLDQKSVGHFLNPTAGLPKEKLLYPLRFAAALALQCIHLLAMKSCIKTHRGFEKNRAPRNILGHPREIQLRHVTVDLDLEAHYRERIGPTTGPGGIALHDVRGHWCAKHDTGDPFCSHAWLYHGEGGTHRVCKTCGRRSWWRAPHQRGDARFGVVTKDYVLKGAEVVA